VAEAKKLQEQHEIPFRIAYQIVIGEIDLETYLAAAARKAEIQRLVEQEGMNGGIAARIVDGELSLSEGRFLTRWSRYRQENYSRSVLIEAERNARTYCFGLFSGEIVDAQVEKNEKYEVILKIGDELRKLHKLELKFVVPEEHRERALAQLRVDEEVRSRDLRPQPRILDRYRLRNQDLFRCLEERTVLFITLLSGDVLRGIIDWFSLYEIGMALRGGVPLTTFRHAIYSVRPKKGGQIGGFRSQV
jgi:sRNA-binding regulator protein Hfq